MTIDVKIQEVSAIFEKHTLWENRYKELIILGKSMPKMNPEYKIEKYEVKGCQSQVWLFSEFKAGKVYFYGDSDALIVKGIVALLIKVYSEETPETILNTPTDFLNDIGITEHLSMNRTNGLASIVKSMFLYAKAFRAMELLKK